ncbi:MAG: hypothetical protein A2297_07345 [Elusimicrobia bacterium RIFOXYB2_FULL_48_7]|nr:MAG: hypothetical protein A2297_07345 [Elusimicrobia bacterium RIFOXYB2_FULL_48_7]
MIEGAILKKLTVHKDERGRLFEIMRSDDEMFEKFGQCYITVCNPGWVKGWHFHKKQVDFFCVLRGKSRIVLCDKRKKSTTYDNVEEFVICADEPSVLRIPKGVIHGFETVGDEPSWIMNMPTRLYNRAKPDEFRLPLDSGEVKYEPWKTRKGW